MNTFEIRSAPLPANFKGTLSDLYEAILDRLEVVTHSDVFQTLDFLPETNEGPVLLGGTKWYVWDEGTSAYVPLDISDSETEEIIISETEPTDSPPRIWIKTTGTEFDGIYVYMGSTAGWVLQTSVLQNNAITTAMIADGAVTADKLSDDLQVSDIPGLFPVSRLSLGLAWQVARMKANASAAEWQDMILASDEVAIVGGSGGTANMTYTTPHALGVLPRYLNWVLVCKVTEGGWAVDEEMDALAALDSNDHDNCSTDIRSTTELGLVVRRTIQPPQRDGSGKFLITPASWKLKAYYAR